MLIDAPGTGKTTTVSYALQHYQPSPGVVRVKANHGCMHALARRLAAIVQALPETMDAQTMLDELQIPCFAAVYRIIEQYLEASKLTDVSKATCFTEPFQLPDCN